MSAEVLRTCPDCGAHGFLARGLKAHRGTLNCQRRQAEAAAASPSLPSRPSRDIAPSPAMSNKTAKHALTVLAAPELRSSGDDTLAKLQAAALAQLAAVGEMESKAALGGVLSGMTLLRVKASMPHGTFGKWLQDSNWNGRSNSTPASRQRTAGYYMRLALIFVEKTKATVPDLLALPGDQLSLDLADNAAGKRLAAKLQKFVGDCSLYELLVKHGIRGVTRDADEAGGEDGAATPAGEDFFAEVATTLEGWRKIVTDRAALVRLTPQQLDLLHESVTADYTEFKKLYKATRGKSAPGADA